MRFRLTASATLVLFMAAAPSFAAISRANEDWGKSPVQHLMTREELKQWKSIGSDDDAQAFIDLFWARRDPTPGTPRNEFRVEFDARVKLADERFKEANARGAMTDRGKTIILLGAPTRITKRTEAASSAPGTGDPTAGAAQGETLPSVSETWVYEGARVPSFINAPKVEFLFRDEFGQGRFRAVRSQVSLNDAWQKAQQLAIKSPNLSQAPAAQPPLPPVPPVVAAAPPAPAGMTLPTSFKTESLQAAFTDFKRAKTSPYKDVFVTYGEFVTPAGEYFIPVQLYMSRNPSAELDKPVTFFGVIEDAAGKVVGVFEEPVTVQASKNEFFADKSLMIPAGKYSGTFGITLEGKPLAIARTELALAGMDKDASGISRLILSNNIFPLIVAQLPTDPFAFGGIKVVPKGNRVFTREDELWYFFELRNPGVDENGKTRVQVKVDVEAKAGQKMGAPLQEQPAEPLKGVPGHYGVGSSIPLAGFTPGEYTIKLKVIDTIKKQTYNLEEKFRVTG